MSIKILRQTLSQIFEHVCTSLKTLEKQPKKSQMSKKVFAKQILDAVGAGLQVRKQHPN